MALENGFFPVVLKRWLQPVWVAFVVGLGLAAWIGWAGYRAWFDRPLPTSTISAHQIRLNTAQLKSLDTKLDQYHHPLTPATVSNDVFLLQ